MVQYRRHVQKLSVALRGQMRFARRMPNLSANYVPDFYFR
jgi:hypothetical protein